MKSRASSETYFREPRIPLTTALGLYWRYFPGLILLSALMALVPGFAWNRILVSIMLVVSAFTAGTPFHFKNAPYSFWLVAGLVWALSLMLFTPLARLAGLLPGAG